MERREVRSRSNALIRHCANLLAQAGVTPNQISIFSIAAAALVPAGLLLVGGFAGVVLAFAGVQLRLLANVLDGLVAIEGGKSTAVGALYNEFPDRISDTAILVSLGYCSHQPDLGWGCALFAALTAYVRVFGGALGLVQAFTGPMAKQHRMAVCSVALLAVARPTAVTPWVIPSALSVIAIGSAWTCVRRTRAIASQLNTQQAA